MSRGGKLVVLGTLILVPFGLEMLARGQDKTDPEKPRKHPDQLVVTKHSIMVKGKKLDYTATAGYLTLKDDQQKDTANIFFIAYTRDGADLATRPVTFAFNGGPGSSSVWLHMGVLGP